MVERAAVEKVCPECAETVKAEARVCRFCGYRFAPEVQPGVTAPPPLSPSAVSGTPTVIVSGSFGKREWFLLWGVASALLMAIGSFGPWVVALGSSVSGTDGSNDGWIVVVVAVLGALLFVSTRNNRGAGLWALIAGVIGAAVTIHDRSHVAHVLNQGNALVQALVHVGWGLNLAMIASISFALCGLFWLMAVDSVLLSNPLSPRSNPLMVDPSAEAPSAPAAADQE